MRDTSPIRPRSALLAAVAVAVLAYAPSAHAYIGPGAGFAFLSSFLVLFATFALAFLTLLTWPIRWLLGAIRGRKPYRNARVDRVVVLGLDGLDPDIAEQYMDAGIMPHFARLRDEGAFARLGTTTPAMSPVAWSSFQTGASPARHGIFDFLTPDRRTYMAKLSSTEIRPPARQLTLGKYVVPLGKPSVRLLRKSRPFWSVLGDHGIFSTVLRVPITFPPEKFNGVLLSAMCVPDLRGTQGSFTFYTTRKEYAAQLTGGEVHVVEARDGTVQCELPGPENFLRRDPEVMRLPFRARLRPEEDAAILEIDGQKIRLRRGEYSAWVKVRFRAGPGMQAQGICRFLLKEVSPEFSLYVTPINVDPEKPSLPISHPVPFSIYLAKMQGDYATLGLAEDTWALNEGIITEAEFLEQTYAIHDEREQMFFQALERTRRGLCVCVFDATDRIQHMFMRYLDPDHPANRGKDTEIHRDAIKDLYRKADDLLGRTMAHVDDRTALFVMSDHGFKSFRRGVNLNSWLHQNGYLALEEGATRSGEWFKQVDWGNTRAYALGLGGLFVNLRGRESQGIVAPGDERHALVAEIVGKLNGLPDTDTGHTAVKTVRDAREIFKGPYVDRAPDIVVGYAAGYRASWAGVTGIVDETVFDDNDKRWSGDHCIESQDVPGVLFCNRKLDLSRQPEIIDIAPTVLSLFGVGAPGYMEGRALTVHDADADAGRQE